MSLNDQIAEFFKDWGAELNTYEREALIKQASEATSINSWRSRQIASVITSGVTAGITGGFWSVLAIPADLIWCRKVAPIACLGIGIITNGNVDFEHDMNLIMAIWSGVGEASVAVPMGKVGIKTTAGVGLITAPKLTIKIGSKVAGKGGGKVAGKAIGKVISKTSLKGGSKVLAKLTEKIVAKGVTKLSAKIATKVGVGWIPIVGGIASGGVNYWLLETLMNAAEEYYSKPYVIFNEQDLSA